jgi:hypothetical protein
MCKKLNVTSITRKNVRENGENLFFDMSKNTFFDINQSNKHQKYLKNHVFLHNSTRSIGKLFERIWRKKFW